MIKRLIFLTLIYIANTCLPAQLPPNPNQEQCKSALVSLLEQKSDTKTLQELFAKCAAHGNAQEQLQAAKEYAIKNNKPQVIESINQKNNDLTTEQQKQTEIKSGWRWYHYIGAFVGAVYAVAGWIVCEQEVEKALVALDDKKQDEKAEKEKKAKKEKEEQEKKIKQQLDFLNGNISQQ